MDSIEQRFWRHSVPEPNTGCWLWIGAAYRNGYGQVSIAGRLARAHRVAWELVNGPIPPGLYVCHRCDNPPCVNPVHLFLGTHGDNVRDMVAKGRDRHVTSAQQRAAFRRRPWRIHSTKLTDEQVAEILSLKGRMSMRTIGARYGITSGYVSRLINGQRRNVNAPPRGGK